MASVRPSANGNRMESVTTGSVGISASTRRSNSSIPSPEGGHQHQRPSGASTSLRAVRYRSSVFESKPVHLIQHAQPGPNVDAQLPQNLIDFVVELIMVGIRDVAYMQYQSRFPDFFEGRAKRRQQSFGQIADESYGIGNKNAAV